MALQQEIIQALGVKPAVDAQEEIRRSVDFLKSYLKTNPFLKSLVLGISGGQDSTLTGKLCQQAISELREETGDIALQFIAVRLPYGVQADEQDCQDAITFIQPDRVLTVWQQLRAMANVGEMTLMSHFAEAEHPDGISSAMARIEQAAEGLECRRSLSNSAATLWHQEAHFDWVRPGIILYGASPSGQWRDIANTGLRPVMTLSSEIIGVQTLKAGERVGYGGRYTARDEQRIGIVAAGYADGYPRHAPTGTPVLVDGVRTMTVGTVSMDMLAVDLTPCPQAGIGTPVELWGKEIKIDDVAAAAGTVGYELMCALALRVPVVTV